MRNRLPLRLIVLVAALRWLPGDAACLPYEATRVSISGRLALHDFPGPPNHEDPSSANASEVYWFLELDPAVCVTGTPGADDPNAESVSDVRSIQLVVANDVYMTRQGLIGKRVIATGTLFHGISGHHHSDVLLMVTTLAKAH